MDGDVEQLAASLQFDPSVFVRRVQLLFEIGVRFQRQPGAIRDDARRDAGLEVLDAALGRVDLQAIPGLLADHDGKFGIEHQGVRRWGVRRQVGLDVLRAALLVAPDQQAHRLRQRRAFQCMHRQQRVHERPLVVSGAAAVDVPVFDHAGEGRSRPLLLVDRLNVAVNDEAEDRRAGRTGQFDLSHRPRVARLQTEVGGGFEQPRLLIFPRLIVPRHGRETHRLGEQLLGPRRRRAADRQQQRQRAHRRSTISQTPSSVSRVDSTSSPISSAFRLMSGTAGR